MIYPCGRNTTKTPATAEQREVFRILHAIVRRAQWVYVVPKIMLEFVKVRFTNPQLTKVGKPVGSCIIIIWLSITRGARKISLFLLDRMRSVNHRNWHTYEGLAIFLDATLTQDSCMVAPGQVWRPGFLTEYLALVVDEKVFN